MSFIPQIDFLVKLHFIPLFDLTHSYKEYSLLIIPTNKECAMQRAKREIDWNKLGFGKIFGDYKFEQRYVGSVAWEGRIVPHGPMMLDPAAGVINYGDGLIGGLRAQSTVEGKVFVFRPDTHAMRMTRDAAHYGMPCDVNTLMHAVVATVRANKFFIPPYSKDGRRFLYIRPQLLGTGINFTIGAAPETTLAMIVSPCETFTTYPYRVIAYPLAARADAIRKTITNYSPYNPQCRVARAQGFSQILHLDPLGIHPEEVGPANVFFVMRDGRLTTPSLTRKSILPGITRHSVKSLAVHLNMEVLEYDIPLIDLLPECVEAFACGTAVGITPIDEIFFPHLGEWSLDNDRVGCTHYQEYGASNSTIWKLSSSCRDSITQRLRRELVGIQGGTLPDIFGWNYEVTV